MESTDSIYLTLNKEKGAPKGSIRAVRKLVTGAKK
jgi:hypothetical protein